jgi:hypothetical protein
MALTKVTNDLQDALAAAQPTITSTGTLTGLTVTGEITANGGIALGDNDELTLGDSDEFKIKHHASGYTHLQNTVGTLYIDSDSVTFRDDDGSPSNMVISQTGINVAGTVTVDDASGTATIALNDSRSNVNDTAVIDFRHNGITGSQIKSTAIEDFSTSANRSSDLSFHVRNNGTIIDAAHINASGNLGIGVVPESWTSTRPALQIGTQSSLSSYNTDGRTLLSTNAYHDSVSNRWEYIANDHAMQYEQYQGLHRFQVAPSGTADAAISWTTAMEIDNSGRVSIGRSSDVTAKCLELQPPAQISDFGSYILNIGGDEADDAVGTKSGIGFGYTSTARPAAPATIGYETKNTSGGTYGDLYFATRATSGTEQPTERMSIDSNGNILSQFGSAVGYGQTSGSGGMCYRNEYGSAGGALIVTNDADTGWSSMYLNKFDWSSGKDDRMMQFSINGNGVGYIRSTSSGTSFVTSSDYRLKENVVPMIGSIDRVKALKPSRFNFIVDADKTVDGFLAHEAQEVVPECVTGTKDAMKDEEYEVTAAVYEVRDEDDNVTTEAAEAVMGTRSVPDMQGIDQSKLVPLLVAALQEAIARIEILEGE